jgi:hypothetical protein
MLYTVRELNLNRHYTKDSSPSGSHSSLQTAGEQKASSLQAFCIQQKDFLLERTRIKSETKGGKSPIEGLLTVPIVRE